MSKQNLTKTEQAVETILTALSAFLIILGILLFVLAIGAGSIKEIHDIFRLVVAAAGILFFLTGLLTYVKKTELF